jgi:hypothetical protein
LLGAVPHLNADDVLAVAALFLHHPNFKADQFHRGVGRQAIARVGGRNHPDFQDLIIDLAELMETGY